MSVADLKRRALELGVELPKGALEKAELQELVEQAEEAQRGAEAEDMAETVPEIVITDGLKRTRRRSVAQLKSRLSELGLEIPTTIVEKTELEELVAEAERQTEGESVHKILDTPAHLDAPSKAAPANVPAPWYTKESRSKPGRFYYVNAETGETTWTSPAPVLDEAYIASLESTVTEHKDAADGKSLSTVPPEVVKHDYRDEAFKDTKEPLLTVQGERKWSRTASISSIQGDRGVQSLEIASLAKGEEDGPPAWHDSADQAATAAAEAAPTESKIQVTATVQAGERLVEGSRFTWVRGQMLGRGALGRVYRATVKATGRIMAVKEVAINADDETDKPFLETMQNEVQIMQELQHPHIVSYYGHDFIDSSLFVYLEYMPGGTLTQALQQFGPFEECLIAKYSKQLLDGLEYMHTRSPPVIHRDIKGSNTLIAADGRVKLADFGCSRRTDHTLTHTMRGSIPWMAPEVVAHCRHGRAADVWSFGCVVIEMGTAKVPWGGFDNQMAALVKIGLSGETPPLPEGLSGIAEDFIRGCVQHESSSRPTATELLGHELVRDIPPVVP